MKKEREMKKEEGSEKKEWKRYTKDRGKVRKIRRKEGERRV
jgi:hypothetical protein